MISSEKALNDSVGEPELLVWAYWYSDKAGVYNFRTQEQYNSFQLETRRQADCDGWTHVYSIPDTKLMVSLKHHVSDSASYTIFDLSEKNPRRVYMSEVSAGNAGYGDISYNSKRNMMILIPVKDKFTYEIFDFNTFEVSRKSKWLPQHKDIINGISIDFEGKLAATIDNKCVLVLSEISHVCSLKLGHALTTGNLCKWSNIPTDPIIYAKYNEKFLNIFDVEKCTLTHTCPIELDAFQVQWIDCRYDGNLLASCGLDGVVKIYDRREKEIIKKIRDIHTSHINCVRWHPNGKILATAGPDNKTNLIDFSSEKVVWAGTKAADDPKAESEDGNMCSVCFV